MKFLVDAQLPRKLSNVLNELGHDTIHTLELPLENRTPDSEIAEIADREGRTVITKDSDFVTSYYLQGTPNRLLLISTGNIGNEQLIQCLLPALAQIVEYLNDGGLIEFSSTAIVVH